MVVYTACKMVWLLYIYINMLTDFPTASIAVMLMVVLKSVNVTGAFDLLQKEASAS